MELRSECEQEMEVGPRGSGEGNGATNQCQFPRLLPAKTERSNSPRSRCNPGSCKSYENPHICSGIYPIAFHCVCCGASTLGCYCDEKRGSFYWRNKG